MIHMYAFIRWSQQMIFSVYLIVIQELLPFDQRPQTSDSHFADTEYCQFKRIETLNEDPDNVFEEISKCINSFVII